MNRAIGLVAAVLTAFAFYSCGSGSGGGETSGSGADTLLTPTHQAEPPSPTRAGDPVAPTPSPAPTAPATATATPESGDARVRAAYPDLSALYGADFGIYRSCGPNFGVCHNSRQYPNLRSLESVADAIGRPCNQLRDNPLEVHEWCEGRGDLLRVGGQGVEIAYFELLDAEAMEWLIHLRDDPPDLSDETVDIVRDLGTEIRVQYAGLENGQLSAIPATEGGPAVRIAPPPSGPFEYAEILSEAFAGAGVPGDPNAIMLGDPNRNGQFGADLGNALILPGDPSGSYLMRRLTDPQFGTLMPLANCCFWTKDSLRALWCWIAGLDTEGANAFDPIDYESCPAGPVESVLYPEPGPDCESQGICPVRASVTPGPGDGFAAVFSIMRASCAGADCHVGGAAGGFAIPDDEETAYDAVRSRVVPGAPDDSSLYVRIDRTLCDLPDCIPMPFGRPPLPPADADAIRQWIADGAQR